MNVDSPKNMTNLRCEGKEAATAGGFLLARSLSLSLSLALVDTHTQHTQHTYNTPVSFVTTIS